MGDKKKFKGGKTCLLRDQEETPKPVKMSFRFNVCLLFDLHIVPFKYPYLLFYANVNFVFKGMSVSLKGSRG